MINYLFKSVNLYVFLGGAVAGALAILVVLVVCRFVLGHWREILIICAIIVACCAILVVLGG